MISFIENRANTCLALLGNLEALLEAQSERNWLRGIKAAIAEFAQTDGSVHADGFENARSIYLSMTAGGRGFSEYHIWENDDLARVSANLQLDEIRAELWLLFNSKE